jgi:flavin reductase (DIM6/NTAB) family NADH-FMN oxidoreductase RutF
MAKINWKAGTMLYPLPAVMVSCGATPEEYNIITIAWTGIISTNPPRCYISVRPERHSYDIIKRNGEFVINLTNMALAKETDWCGVRSGKNFDKFKEMNLTPGKAHIVKSPIIEEAPLHIECKVFDIVNMGSHDMFLADIVNVIVDDNYVDENETLNFERIHALAYAHGFYYQLGNSAGKFGFSVNRKEGKKKK